MALHEVQLKGYSVRPSNLSLGTFDSYGIEQLHVTADDSWDGLDILAVFHAPDGTATKVVVGADGMLAVPPEATAKQAGVGRIVFVGLAENVQRITVDMGYNIKPHADIDGDNPGTPTPDVVQQILENSNHAVSIATAAQEASENARQAAEDAAKKAGEGAGGAGQAAGEAAQSAKAAEIAKQSAEHAAKKALEAKTGSEIALQDADAAKDAASGYANAAAKSATAAADSEKNAAKSANSAAESAAAAKKSADDANNTANSIKDSMAQISENKEAVSKLKEDTAALKKHQNVLVGSETGNPVSCNDAYSAPLCGLTVYGKSTQDGTPTPDAPVPIVSSGDGGTVVVKVSDGNGKEQTLTLQTPTGLPGIPVTSGGNYTDQNGQQWICDEVGLERGVRVQRVRIKALNPDIAWSYRKTNRGNNNFQTRIYNADVALSRKPCFCNILHYTSNVWDDIPQNLPKIYANDQEITISFPPNSEYSSLEAFKQLLTDVKSVIYYALTTPIETQLTPAEIAAYKALTAYAPDTVVQASDGAGVKLEYQRDVNIAIKNLEDAIASMTTT